MKTVRTAIQSSIVNRQSSILLTSSIWLLPVFLPPAPEIGNTGGTAGIFGSIHANARSADNGYAPAVETLASVWLWLSYKSLPQ